VTLPSSYRKANNHDDGPFRKVVDVELLSTGYRGEVLECGHRGRVLPNTDWATPAKKRRCWDCRDEDARRSWNPSIGIV
jgi:hypothetical protein